MIINQRTFFTSVFFDPTLKQAFEADCEILELEQKISRDESLQISQNRIKDLYKKIRKKFSFSYNPDTDVIQSGSFGAVYKVRQMSNMSKEYALKTAQRNEFAIYQLKNERTILAFLNQEEAKEGKSYVAQLIGSVDSQAPPLFNPCVV